MAVVGWDKPGDSPWGAQKDGQDPFVGDLLRAEVDMLDPAEVVIICGPSYWHSAAKPARLDELPKAEGPSSPPARSMVGHGSSGITHASPAGASASGPTRTPRRSHAQ